jgi:hypothetical protein
MLFMKYWKSIGRPNYAPSARRVIEDAFLAGLAARSATRRIDGVDWCVLRDGCYQPGRCLEEKRCCHEVVAADNTTAREGK